MTKIDRLVVRPCSRCGKRKVVKDGKARRNQYGVIKFTCYACELERNENLSPLLGERVKKE